MAIHSLRIESDSEWCAIEIRSSGTWARGPGRAITLRTDGSEMRGARLEIADRLVQLVQDTESRAALRLEVQLACIHDRVSLRTRKGSSGMLRVTSAANARVNEGRDGEGNTLEVLLFLSAATAREAGAEAGDPGLG